MSVSSNIIHNPQFIQITAAANTSHPWADGPWPLIETPSKTRDVVGAYICCTYPSPLLAEIVYGCGAMPPNVFFSHEHTSQSKGEPVARDATFVHLVRPLPLRSKACRVVAFSPVRLLGQASPVTLCDEPLLR